MKKVLLYIIIIMSSCIVGDGEGSVSGVVNIPSCGFENEYIDLKVNFFVAEILENKSSLKIRVQKGGFYQIYSDGIVFYVDDFKYVNNHLNETLHVGCSNNDELENNINGENLNCLPFPDQPAIRSSFYLNESCDNFNTVGFIEASGTIVFNSIYTEGDNKTIEANFNLRFYDPRVDENGLFNEANIHGYFKFEYKAGRPAQSFP